MRDFLGYRKIFGVITPSINTCVQPEYDSMRPPGVTNQVAHARLGYWHALRHNGIADKMPGHTRLLSEF
jgi:hypothetical protein